MKTDIELFKRFAKKSKQDQERIEGNNCIIYTRVSSKEQEDGYSLDTQKNEIKRFTERRKLNCIGFFGGKFESASKAERAEFTRMINFARRSKEKVSYILVAHTDRFDRRGANAIYMADILRKENIRILSVSNPVDTNTPEGKFSQNIQFVASELENDLRRKKCTAGMLDMLRDGYWPSKVPAGYSQRMEKREQIVWVNELGEKLRKAFQWRAENKYTNLEIIEKLKTMGVRMPKSRLSEMFKNPFYCGLLSHNLLNGELIEGKHEKLISKELFARINNLESKNPRGKTAKEFLNVPLKHFIKCGECGSPFVGYLVRKKNLWYYKCNKKGCKCNRRNEHLNSKFISFLSNFRIEERFVNPIKDAFMELAKATQQESIQNESIYKSQLTEANKRLEATEEKYICNEISRDIYDKYSVKYKAEKAQILEQMDANTINLSNLEKSISKYCNLLTNVPSLWASGSYYQKREIQNLIFPEGIHYFREIDDYRTPKINTPALQIAELAGNLEGIKNKTAGLLSSGSASVQRAGLELPKENIVYIQ